MIYQKCMRLQQAHSGHEPSSIGVRSRPASVDIEATMGDGSDETASSPLSGSPDYGEISDTAATNFEQSQQHLQPQLLHHHQQLLLQQAHHGNRKVTGGTNNASSAQSSGKCLAMIIY